MCGIAGIISFNDQPVRRENINAMTCAVAHRGPDSDVFYMDENAALGHRRLSIIDLSDAANQPFTDNSGRYVMVFNGEMYNYQEVKKRLPGYDFKTNGDTEVIVAAFAKWGPECIHYFKGMYAFAVWDKLEQQLTLVRDRMGVKPLYYYYDDNVFLFGSEIRSLLASGMIEKKVNEKALIEYFSYQSVGYPYSIIEGIHQVKAGSYLQVKDSSLKKTEYWDVTKYTDPANLSAGEIRKKIYQLLCSSVEMRLVSDVPVGAFLSGGIDSSAVVALMATVSSARPSTFNISFNEKGFDESEYARLVAAKFNTRHTEIRLDPSVFIDELENALNSMDTPSGDGINTYVVSKAIRNAGVTVALSGIGGDELFAGYPFFSQYLKLQGNKRWYKGTGLLRKVSASLLDATNSVRNHRISGILAAPSPEISNVYNIFRQILSPQLIKTLTTLQGSYEPALTRQLKKKSDNLSRLPLLSQVSAAEYMGYTQHTLLKDTDQMSMAVSLEVREPFFDHELVEFVLGVPDRYKKPTYPKSLLVESLQGLLPDEVVHRPKQGFEFPWKHWMKKELFTFCDDRIKRMADQRFIQSDQLLSYWKRFQKGDPGVRWMELWLFVILQHWLEKNIQTK